MSAFACKYTMKWVRIKIFWSDCLQLRLYSSLSVYIGIDNASVLDEVSTFINTLFKVINFPPEAALKFVYLFRCYNSYLRTYSWHRLVHILQEDLGLVPTDIIASLILLELDQNRRPSSLSQHSIHDAPQTWMTVELAAHYMPFAAAAFGWPAYISHYSFRDFYRVLRHSRSVSQQCFVLSSFLHIIQASMSKLNSVSKLLTYVAARPSLVLF